MKPENIGQPADKHLRIARRVLVEGVRLVEAMRAEGFGARYSQRSLADLRKNSKPLNLAFEIVESLLRAKSGTYDAPQPEDLKSLAISRLRTNVKEGEDRSVKSIRLMGQLKEENWFVQPESQGNHVNIYAHLADPEGDTILKNTASAMKDYFNEPCAWCGYYFDSPGDLQAHSLECSKRPVEVKAITQNTTTDGKGGA